MSLSCLGSNDYLVYVCKLNHPRRPHDQDFVRQSGPPKGTNESYHDKTLFEGKSARSDVKTGLLVASVYGQRLEVLVVSKSKEMAML